MAISFENATLYDNLQTANALLESKNKALMELDQLKDQFLANTSHELRYIPLHFIFVYFYVHVFLILLQFIHFLHKGHH